MTTIPPEDEDTGWYPEGFVNPAEDEEIPWITPATDDDPVPPADRLAEEPETVEVEPGEGDRDPNEHLADELRGGASFPVDTGGESQPRGFVQPGFGGLDLRDYSRTAQQKGWGAPCSAARATVRLSQAAVTVDARVAELVALIMRACEARGYIFRAADTGAYNCRYISGTTVWSNHAWGVAVDVNWQSNPFTTRAGATDIPGWMHDLWNRYGFAWGGDYTGGKRDFMHFEFMGTPQQAAVALDLARSELVAFPTPVPPPRDATTLPIGQTLEAGQELRFGGWQAVMQPDGNFVIYANGHPEWATGTRGSGAVKAAMQTDGNFVLYTADGRVAWHTNTRGRGANRLSLQSDGNLVMYRQDNVPVWARSWVPGR